MKSRFTRVIPAVAVPALVIGAAIIIPVAADASPRLPERSAQEVLQLVAASVDTQYSGTIEQRSDLGLPELPSVGPSSSEASALEFLTGSREARVFVDENQSFRLQVLDQLAERDVVRNGESVWYYDSTGNEAVRLTLDESAEAPQAWTPDELARTALQGLDSSTTVTVSDTARVAGRPVYQLVLTPKSADTLVGSVTLSVDSETGLPLAFEVAAVGQDAAAFSVAFSSVDFTAPDPALFDFTPPANATVTEQAIPGHAQAEEPTRPDVTVTGEGWSAIVSVPADTAGLDAGSESAALLDQFTTPVAGGRAVQTSLVSVLLTDDGRVLIGAVSVAQLQAAAAR